MTKTAETTDQKLARLEAENLALRKTVSSSVTLKVSQKGGLSVNGLQRWPVTLYREQWTTLMSMKDEILSFMETHDSELKHKGDKTA